MYAPAATTDDDDDDDDELVSVKTLCSVQDSSCKSAAVLPRSSAFTHVIRPPITPPSPSNRCELCFHGNRLLWCQLPGIVLGWDHWGPNWGHHHHLHVDHAHARRWKDLWIFVLQLQPTVKLRFQHLKSAVSLKTANAFGTKEPEVSLDVFSTTTLKAGGVKPQRAGTV